MDVVTAEDGCRTFASMLPSIPSPNVTFPDAPKRPRRSWTPVEQAAHLTDFAASGLSATAFCRRLGIRRATLARWRQRAAAAPAARPALRRVEARRGERRPGAAGFAAVTVVADAAGLPGLPAPSPSPAAPVPPSLSLVLRAPSGVAADVAGLDVATAAALLRAVLTPPPAGAA